MLAVALYDTLAVCSGIQNVYGDAHRGEIHFLTYLGCLLSKSDETDTCDWEYGFFATESGTPFSPQISEAISALRDTGALHLSPETRRLRVSNHDLLDTLRASPVVETRAAYIRRAIDCLVYFPIGVIRFGLGQEPGLARARLAGRSRSLLQNGELCDLRSDFEVLREALPPEYQNELVASVWIEHLRSLAIAHGLGGANAS